MYFYDIMYLYKAYEDYVNEENKRQEENQAMYNSQISDIPDVGSQMSKYKMPDIGSSIVKSVANLNIPKF